MFKYEISGYYFEGDERKYFEEIVEASDNFIAMKIVLGNIMLKNSEHNNNNFVKLDVIHYECL